MEEFDMDKDFSKEPFDQLPTHKIYGLSETGFHKYMIPKNTRRILNEQIKNDTIKNTEEHNEKELNKAKTEEKTSSQYPILLTKQIKNEPKNKKECESITNSNNKTISNIYQQYNIQKKINKPDFNKTKASFLKASMLNCINCSNSFQVGSNPNNISIYKLIESQNNYMKNILMKKVLNPVFTKKNKLPKISFSTSRTIDTEIYKSLPKYGNPTSNHKSYFMGGKYNPSNYDLERGKNRTKRNEFGYLFVN